MQRLSTRGRGWGRKDLYMYAKRSEGSLQDKGEDILSYCFRTLATFADLR